MKRRTFLQSAVALVIASTRDGHVLAQRDRRFDVHEKTIAELQAAMTSGAVTAVQLVEQYLRRIDAYDRNGPRLNSVLHINPRAVDEARALDRERRVKGPRGPLHGIPALLKDNFDTSDMPTTGGCLALAGVVPRDDAHQVRRLREAGVILLGKRPHHRPPTGRVGCVSPSARESAERRSGVHPRQRIGRRVGPPDADGSGDRRLAGGKLYVSAVSRSDPRRSARAGLRI